MILVTGAAGFIGFSVARALLQAGHAVLGADNLNDYYDVRLKEARLSVLREYASFEFERLDIGESDRVSGLFERYLPSVVVHLAAQAGVQYSLANPHAYLHSNMLGFLNVCEASKAHGVEHLIYASSSSVYGSSSTIPFTTDQSVMSPVSFYAATKIANEATAHTYAHLYGLKATGLRFFTVYGPWGRPDMAYWKFTEAILHGDPIKLHFYGKAARDFTYIDDVVRAILRMVEAPVRNARENQADSRIYNIGNHTPVSLSEFVEEIEHALQRKAIIELGPPQPGDVEMTYADVSALQADYGFSPDTPLADGIDRFVDWYLDRWLPIAINDR